MLPPRSPALAVLVTSAVLGLVAGIGAVVLATRDDSAERRVVVFARVAESRGLRVLRGWDARRSRAYARADVAGLGDLYVPGSRTGASDRAVLRGYRDRGLRVSGMRTQLLGAQVLHDSERRITVLVTDVLLDAVADDGGGRRWALPQDRASLRRVLLVRHDGTWRVAEAYAVP
jgi:hypothetical protein